MQLTDTHCHLDFNQFDSDRDAVIVRAKIAGVIRFLVPGLDHDSSQAVVRLAESDPSVFAAVGFHPTNIEHLDKRNFQAIEELAGHPKVVAIGETGLDHFWIRDEAIRAAQNIALKRQLALAEIVNKPVIIHMREENDVWFGSASVNILEILSEWQVNLKAKSHPLANRPGVLHSFNGTLETAQKAIRLNFYIGVTGPVTYKNADEKRRTIAEVPLERLLIETDSPFLSPVPHRGKRNEPAFVGEIADKIAGIKSRSLEEIAAATTANAKRLFLW